jgi:hypothetical protein
MPKIDTPTVTSGPVEKTETKRWVEIPERDLFDFPYPHVRINLLDFGPGRHYVDAELADSIEERVRVKNQADLRIMRPTKDVTSENAMNRFGSGAMAGGRSANPNSFPQA